MNRSLAVIGGGAAGLCAAIEARKENAHIEITVFEKLSKPAKKILATGNGRCNFTNQDLSPIHFHGEKLFLRKILTSQFADIENFFLNMGILPYYEDGRVYPRSQQASTIRDMLLSFCESNNIKITTDFDGSIVKKTDAGYCINGEIFDGLIICAGGKASSVHGSDGSLYKTAEGFGHKITPLYPALCGISVKDKDLNQLKGVRAEAKAQLFEGNMLLGDECGEIQFTDKGISGIPIMNLSHLCEDRKDLRLVFDLCPEKSAKELSENMSILSLNAPQTTAEMFLNGIVNNKLAFAIVNRLKLNRQRALNSLSHREKKSIINLLKGFEFTVKEVRGFDNAQITKGGIDTDEIHPETMMSKYAEGLFFAGEIINIHGDCGGYNLHLAFTTGRIAGNSAARYLSE